MKTNNKTFQSSLVEKNQLKSIAGGCCPVEDDFEKKYYAPLDPAKRILDAFKDIMIIH